MGKRLIHFALISTLFCDGSLLAAETKASSAADHGSAQESVKARVVHYGPQDLVRVQTRLRYTTLIILPEEEKILDFTCGDKEFWAIDGVENFAYVKPATKGAKTNINLITASGNVYSFVLAEISDQPNAQLDLKLFVEPKDASMVTAMQSNPRFVPSRQIEDFRDQISMAKAETRETKEAARKLIEEEISRFRSNYPTNLQFVYRFKTDEKPFRVKAIYHDGKFTYIEADPEETPALYEIKDGKPSLVDFEYRNGTFVVSKVVNHGYLAIGKKRMNFTREE